MHEFSQRRRGTSFKVDEVPPEFSNEETTIEASFGQYFAKKSGPDRRLSKHAASQSIIAQLFPQHRTYYKIITECGQGRTTTLKTEDTGRPRSRYDPNAPRSAVKAENGQSSQSFKYYENGENNQAGNSHMKYEERATKREHDHVKNEATKRFKSDPRR